MLLDATSEAEIRSEKIKVKHVGNDILKLEQHDLCMLRYKHEDPNQRLKVASCFLLCYLFVCLPGLPVVSRWTLLFYTGSCLPGSYIIRQEDFRDYTSG